MTSLRLRLRRLELRHPLLQVGHRLLQRAQLVSGRGTQLIQDVADASRRLGELVDDVLSALAAALRRRRAPARPLLERLVDRAADGVRPARPATVALAPVLLVGHAASLRFRAVSRAPVHLRPTAPLADRVLLPGDPGRALLLAQELLDAPKMFNHHRGLWGYTGEAADGSLLTVQATGMGGPSCAIVLEELVDLGVRSAIRVGTCGALNGSLQLGDVVVAADALSDQGSATALGAPERVAASLVDGLEGDAVGTLVSTDLFYDPREGLHDAWRAAGALAVEMEAATLFRIGERRGIAVGCVCAVSDVIPEGSRIGDDELEAASKRVGRIAQKALEKTSG
jgi:DeoD family purine-nucleoside phosphorylase